MRTFWLSFCDPDRPKGQKFLGVCLIEVTRDEADLELAELQALFPNAHEGAQWYAAALRKAHRLGCNPGGEVGIMELPANHPYIKRCAAGVLLDAATIAQLDALIERMKVH